MKRLFPALAVFAVLGAMILYGHGTAPIANPWFWWLLAVNLLAVLVYGLDKRAARKRTRRVPEKTLHLLGLSGGWPGALLAQRLFRHKTAKRDFRIMFAITICVNVALFIWLHSTTGLPFLRLIDSLMLY